MKTTGHTETLFSLRKQVKSGLIKLPEWQRKKAWSQTAIKSWAKTIQSSSIVPNTIALSQIEGQADKNVWYINDGAQRLIHSLNDLEDDWNEKSPKLAESILTKCSIFVHKKIYPSRKEILEDFTTLNSTPSHLTVFEVSQTLLEDESLSAAKKHFLREELHLQINSIVDAASGCNLTADFNSKMNKKSTASTFPIRTRYHARLRDNLALFARFINKENSNKTYKVATKQFGNDEKQKNRILQSEFDVITHVKNTSISDLREELEKFCSLLNTYKGNIIKAKDDYKKKNILVEDTVVRWFFNFALIYGFHNKMKKVLLQKFITSVIHETGGRATLYCNSSKRVLALQKTADFKVILEKFGIKTELEIRKKEKEKLIKGFDHSHIDSFAENGNGPVESFPSSLNRASGKTPLQEVKKSLLSNNGK